MNIAIVATIVFMDIGPQIGAVGLSNILKTNCAFFCNDGILITNILFMMASGAKSPEKEDTSSVIEVLAQS